MAKELKPLEIGDNPELLRLVKQIQRADAPRVLRQDGKDVAVLTPVKKRRRVKDPKPTTADSPLWEIIGIAERLGEGLDPDRPTDVSSNKHKYLAEAYADLHTDE